MASFFAPLRRILRRDWKYGLWPLNGKKPDQLTVQDLEQSLRATNGAVQALAEEIAMLRLPQDMTHDGQVEARNWCPGVQDIPPKMWLYDELCSAGASDNPLSHFNSDGNIRNGVAHKFRGIVFIEGGNIILRERRVNDPKGPGGPPAKNPNPPGITIINRNGQIVGICAVGIVSGTMSARSGRTLGSGLCTVQTLTNVTVADSRTETVLNPHDFAISDGTYVMLGQVPRRNGQNVYVIIEVNGVFTPAYAVRLADDTNQSITAATAATVALATDVHKYPNDDTVFAISSNEITIKKSGLYHFSYMVPWRAVAADAYAQAWLEEDTVKIKGSCMPGNPTTNSTECDGISGSIDHKVDVSGGNKVYRLRFISSATSEVLGTDDANTGGYGRMDIRWVRSL